VQIADRRQMSETPVYRTAPQMMIAMFGSRMFTDHLPALTDLFTPDPQARRIGLKPRS